MSRVFALLPLVTAMGCPGTPGELRPLFDAIVGLPAYLEPPVPPPSFEMPLRNVGETTVTITGFRFEDNEGATGQSARFTELEFDTTTVEPDLQAVLRFEYETPDGAAQEALLIIETDSTTKPVLEIPVSTVEYIVGPDPDGGVSDAGDDDAGVPVDAGDGDDAGEPIDAGGGDDAGEPIDAGGGDDAGAPVDAGGGDDAGAPIDAGGGDDAGAPVDGGPIGDAG